MPDCSMYISAAQHNGCIGGYVVVCAPFLIGLVALVVAVARSGRGDVTVSGEAPASESRPQPIAPRMSPWSLDLSGLVEVEPVPVSGPRCSYCGTLFDGKETICKHCGGTR